MSHGILNGLCAGAVGLNRLAFTPKCGYLIGDGLGFISGFFIRNNHVSPRLGQRQRDGTPQTTTGAGNQRLLTR
ncbi:hypothetical protein D3C71_1011570 [compost metagenome]